MDPDASTDSILVQYQAQLSSAIRTALSNESPPVIRSYVSDVVLHFLSSPFAGHLVRSRLSLLLVVPSSVMT